MASSDPPPPPTDAPPAKRRKCAICKQEGHDRRNCPTVPRATAVARVANPPNNPNPPETVPSPPPFVVEPVPESLSINWERVLYVVFDLETTGRSPVYHEIIEVAAVILDPNGVPIEDATFAHYVKPQRPIPSQITFLTTITNDLVQEAPRFGYVGASFIQFMQQTANDFQQISDVPVEHLVLVGHNSRTFDVPFLLRSMIKYRIEETFFSDRRFGLALDTLRIAKSAVRNRACPVVPSAYNLSTLFQFVTGNNLENAHQALNDVKATVSVLCYEHFWQQRVTEAFRFQRPDEEEQQENDSSEDDNSVAGSAESQSSEEDEDEEAPSTVPAGNRWEDDVQYWPWNPTPAQKFLHHFTSLNRSQRNKTGLQCNPMDVSTPIRAWRQIFTKTLLDKIVKYTNEYGEAKAKDWSDITRKDLELFMAVLFVTSIQKRKDKPSNWFSHNKLIDCPLVKRIMSGRKFLTILRYLHVCEMKQENPNSEGYDPAYKVAELRDYLEKRYSLLFIPGQQLSLDETLIRAFGRIKFKVRIVSKAARYGIKVYVITDATTAYVLRVVIYTGRTTYTQAGEVNDHPMKTVQIVNKLVAPFVGTHRTIYIDRFYTSTELLISLAEKDLYVTGTVLANRIPLNIRIPKASQRFRSMKRGDAVRSKFIFYKADGTESSVGLVGWKDRNMVYCLSNDTNNVEFDECCRRGEDGIIRIPRPIAIANYTRP